MQPLYMRVFGNSIPRSNAWDIFHCTNDFGWFIFSENGEFFIGCKLYSLFPSPHLLNQSQQSKHQTNVKSG